MVIKPLQYHHKAELFDYISQELRFTSEKYKHQEIKCADEPLFTENILSNCALPERVDDEFCKANKDKATNKEGIYINYAIPKSDDYTTLIIDDKTMKIAVVKAEKIANRIKADLESVGLQTPKHFEIEEIET